MHIYVYADEWMNAHICLHRSMNEWINEWIQWGKEWAQMEMQVIYTL